MDINGNNSFGDDHRIREREHLPETNRKNSIEIKFSSILNFPASFFSFSCFSFLFSGATVIFKRLDFFPLPRQRRLIPRALLHPRQIKLSLKLNYISTCFHFPSVPVRSVCPPARVFPLAYPQTRSRCKETLKLYQQRTQLSNGAHARAYLRACARAWGESQKSSATIHRMRDSAARATNI